MRSLIVLATVCGALITTGSAFGQAIGGYATSEVNRLQGSSNPAAYSASRLRANVVNSSVPRYSFAGVTAGLNQNVLGTTSKPFSSIQRGPSVTPYLAFDQPFSNTATSYYTQIRPQLEQQRINQQMQRQQQQMQRQMGEITSRPPYDPQGSENMAPTGHASVYMNYGGYYTPPAPKRR
jgi:hypothetical protein